MDLPNGSFQRAWSRVIMVFNQLATCLFFCYPAFFHSYVKVTQTSYVRSNEPVTAMVAKTDYSFDYRRSYVCSRGKTTAAAINANRDEAKLQELVREHIHTSPKTAAQNNDGKRSRLVTHVHSTYSSSRARSASLTVRMQARPCSRR